MENWRPANIHYPRQQTTMRNMADQVVSPGGSGLERPSPQDGAIPSKHPLPSGEFMIETHFDVLRRFMSASRNGVEYVDALAIEGTGVPLGAARSNSAFLCSIGLLVEEKPGQFKPTAVGMQFINTQLGDDSRGRRLLRSLIEKTWFGAAARSALQAASPKSSRIEDVRSAIAQAAGIPPELVESEIRILMEYLAYTGIYLSDAQVSSGAGDRATPAAAQVQAQAVAVSSTPLTKPVRRSTRQSVTLVNEDAEWEEVQTSEFYLKIEPKVGAVKRLRKQLDLLEEKLSDQGESGRKG